MQTKHSYAHPYQSDMRTDTNLTVAKSTSESFGLEWWPVHYIPTFRRNLLPSSWKSDRFVRFPQNFGIWYTTRYPAQQPRRPESLTCTLWIQQILYDTRDASDRCNLPLKLHGVTSQKTLNTYSTVMIIGRPTAYWNTTRLCIFVVSFLLGISPASEV